MFKNILISAFGAAVAVCLALAAVQAFTTIPLILHAETFENAVEATPVSAPHQHDAGTPAHSHNHDGQEWAPADGLERTLYTALANFVMSVAVAAMLMGGMLAAGVPIDARTGLMWGLGGFIAASLLPSLGLPPELPGTPAAEIVSRQAWWLGTAIASAGGLLCLTMSRKPLVWIAGLVLLVVPHVIGAPHPPQEEVAYPAILAGEFVVASLVVSLLLWSLSGFFGGLLHQRLSRAP